MNSNYNPKTNKFLCECGCGEEVSGFLRSFKKGHHLRTEEGKECMIEAHTGLVYDAETCKRFSEARLKDYRDDPTLAKRISEVQSGRVLSEEHSRHISEGVRRAYRNDPTLADRCAEGKIGRVKSKEECQHIREARSRFLDSEEGEKYRDGMSGENHPNWKGGYSGGYGYGWSAIRELIIIRDNYTCQGCDSKINLMGHHIDGNVDNMDDHNLITVCNSCNQKAGRKYEKEYWFDFYTNRIKEIYSEKVTV